MSWFASDRDIHVFEFTELIAECTSNVNLLFDSLGTDGDDYSSKFVDLPYFWTVKKACEFNTSSKLVKGETSISADAYLRVTRKRKDTIHLGEHALLFKAFSRTCGYETSRWEGERANGLSSRQYLLVVTMLRLEDYSVDSILDWPETWNGNLLRSLLLTAVHDPRNEADVIQSSAKRILALQVKLAKAVLGSPFVRSQKSSKVVESCLTVLQRSLRVCNIDKGMQISSRIVQLENEFIVIRTCVGWLVRWLASMQYSVDVKGVQASQLASDTTEEMDMSVAKRIHNSADRKLLLILSHPVEGTDTRSSDLDSDSSDTSTYPGVEKAVHVVESGLDSWTKVLAMSRSTEHDRNCDTDAPTSSKVFIDASIVSMARLFNQLSRMLTSIALTNRDPAPQYQTVIRNLCQYYNTFLLSESFGQDNLSSPSNPLGEVKNSSDGDTCQRIKLEYPNLTRVPTTTSSLQESIHRIENEEGQFLTLLDLLLTLPVELSLAIPMKYGQPCAMSSPAHSNGSHTMSGCLSLSLWKSLFCINMGDTGRTMANGNSVSATAEGVINEACVEETKSRTYLTSEWEDLLLGNSLLSLCEKNIKNAPWAWRSRLLGRVVELYGWLYLVRARGYALVCISDAGQPTDTSNVRQIQCEVSSELINRVRELCCTSVQFMMPNEVCFRTRDWIFHSTWKAQFDEESYVGGGKENTDNVEDKTTNDQGDIAYIDPSKNLFDAVVSSKTNYDRRIVHGTKTKSSIGHNAECTASDNGYLSASDELDGQPPRTFKLLLTQACNQIVASASTAYTQFSTGNAAPYSTLMVLSLFGPGQVLSGLVTLGLQNRSQTDGVITIICSLRLHMVTASYGIPLLVVVLQVQVLEPFVGNGNQTVVGDIEFIRSMDAANDILVKTICDERVSSVAGQAMILRILALPYLREGAGPALVLALRLLHGVLSQRRHLDMRDTLRGFKDMDVHALTCLVLALCDLLENRHVICRMLDRYGCSLDMVSDCLILLVEALSNLESNQRENLHGILRAEDTSCNESEVGDTQKSSAVNLDTKWANLYHIAPLIHWLKRRITQFHWTTQLIVWSGLREDYSKDEFARLKKYSKPVLARSIDTHFWLWLRSLSVSAGVMNPIVEDMACEDDVPKIASGLVQVGKSCTQREWDYISSICIGFMSEAVYYRTLVTVIVLADRKLQSHDASYMCRLVVCNLTTGLNKRAATSNSIFAEELSQWTLTVRPAPTIAPAMVTHETLAKPPKNSRPSVETPLPISRSHDEPSSARTPVFSTSTSSLSVSTPDTVSQLSIVSPHIPKPPTTPEEPKNMNYVNLGPTSKLSDLVWLFAAVCASMELVGSATSSDLLFMFALNLLKMVAPAIAPPNQDAEGSSSTNVRKRVPTSQLQNPCVTVRETILATIHSVGDVQRSAVLRRCVDAETTRWQHNQSENKSIKRKRKDQVSINSKQAKYKKKANQRNVQYSATDMAS
eukprot:CFRG6122T1